ncbi:MAG: carotenoid biosynthesis protein [Halobacteriaceae archaeon]
MRPLYPAFTAAMFLASLACLRHARGDREAVTVYATSVAYGLVLEKATIVAFHAYSYPTSEYLVAFAGVPLAIGLGWSAVIYAGLATARGLDLPRVAVPGFVALYALHVDLAMDAVAIRVPYWTWAGPGPWFGVPLGNFFGWFAVASLFAATFEVAWRRLSNRLAVAAVVLVGSLVGLRAGLEAWVRVATTDARGAALLVALGAGAAALVAWRRPREFGRPPRVALYATLVFHLFFVGVSLYGGYYRATPALAVVGLGLLGVGLAVHVLPGE